jgi:hypothetical protein
MRAHCHRCCKGRLNAKPLKLGTRNTSSPNGWNSQEQSNKLFNRFISAIHKSNEEQKKFLNTKGSMAFRRDYMMGLYGAASTQDVFGAAELVNSCPQPPTSSIQSSCLVNIDYCSSEWGFHAGIRCWPRKDVHWHAWLALASWTPDPWYMILFS